MEGEFVFPRYDGHSLYNVVPTIFNLLGFEEKRESIPKNLFKEYVNDRNKVILFLIDGFGYSQFKKFCKEIKFLEFLSSKGTVFPITSVFPSTTAASLTTIFTGLTPAEHGLLEWNLYIEEIDQIIQTLPFSHLGRTSVSEELKKERVSSETLLDKSIPTIYQLLAKKGIKSYLFSEDSFINSTYSVVSGKGGLRVTYNKLSDLITQLREYLDKTASSTFFYVYWPNIDSQGHNFGPDSNEYELELKIFFEAIFLGLKKLKKKNAARVIVILTADHGQISVDPGKTIYLNKDKELVEALSVNRNGKKIPPWGNVRDVFLSIQKGKVKETVNYLRQRHGNKALILETKEAIKKGLFGDKKPSSRFLKRVGDILILPYSSNTFWYEHIKGEPFFLLGHHGGLSKQEMLIPFGIARLGDLL